MAFEFNRRRFDQLLPLPVGHARGAAVERHSRDGNLRCIGAVGGFLRREVALALEVEEKGAIKYTIYAFTLLSRVSNSKRVSRKAGTRTWGGQTGPKIIQDSKNGQIIGQSKMLAFEHPGSVAHFGHCTMHEYSLSDDLIISSGKRSRCRGVQDHQDGQEEEEQQQQEIQCAAAVGRD